MKMVKVIKLSEKDTEDFLDFLNTIDGVSGEVDGDDKGYYSVYVAYPKHKENTIYNYILNRGLDF